MRESRFQTFYFRKAPNLLNGVVFIKLVVQLQVIQLYRKLLKYWLVTLQFVNKTVWYQLLSLKFYRMAITIWLVVKKSPKPFYHMSIELLMIIMYIWRELYLSLIWSLLVSILNSDLWVEQSDMLSLYFAINKIPIYLDSYLL